MLKRNFLEFENAREFVRKLEIKTTKEWEKYSKDGRPDFIPAKPNLAYKGKWIDWADWLGKKKPVKLIIEKREKIEFLSFEKAREYVRGLGLKNKREWLKYYKDNKPKFLPACPNITYKNNWKGFPDWMGYNFDIHFNKKYKVNEDFFKTWSPEMAYVLGFWFSDGYIYKNKRNRYIFGISQCEKEILNNILKVMDSNYPLHKEKHEKGKSSYRFIIESKIIVNDIIKLGGVYRKSLISKFPYIPKKYMRDFIRGLWDGDGSAFIDAMNRATATFTCGSKDFIESLFNILKENIDNFRGSIIKDKRRESAYMFSCSPNTSRNLRDFMYYDKCICLKRKEIIFNSMGKIKLSMSDIKKGFISYEDAKEIVRLLSIKKQRDWNKYSLSGERPKNIPSNPWKTYKNNGWIGWHDWLGNGKEKGQKQIKERKEGEK